MRKLNALLFVTLDASVQHSDPVRDARGYRLRPDAVEAPTPGQTVPYTFSQAIPSLSRSRPLL